MGEDMRSLGYEDKLLSSSGVKSPMDYLVIDFGGWDQLPVRVWLTMKIVCCTVYSTTCN